MIISCVSYKHSNSNIRWFHYKSPLPPRLSNKHDQYCIFYWKLYIFSYKFEYLIVQFDISLDFKVGRISQLKNVFFEGGIDTGGICSETTGYILSMVVKFEIFGVFFRPAWAGREIYYSDPPRWNIIFSEPPRRIRKVYVPTCLGENPNISNLTTFESIHILVLYFHKNSPSRYQNFISKGGVIPMLFFIPQNWLSLLKSKNSRWLRPGPPNVFP